MLVGDSITQQAFNPAGGWGARLADAYARRADIVLRGYSGYTSHHALTTLADRLFPPAAGVDGERPASDGPPPPSLITLWFGANDAALPGRGSSSQHVPLDRYEANMAALARAAAAAVAPGSGRVLVIAPPPVHEPGRAAHAAEAYGAPPDKPVDRTLAASGEYAAAACRAAAAAGVACVDMWSLFQAAGGREGGGEGGVEGDGEEEEEDGGGGQHHPRAVHRRHRGAPVDGLDGPAAPGWAALLSDGLHFSPAGQEIAFNAISAAIAEHAAHLAPEALPLDAPEWGALESFVE
jgi:lysophospholipase L1-like esterase